MSDKEKDLDVSIDNRTAYFSDPQSSTIDSTDSDLTSVSQNLYVTVNESLDKKELTADYESAEDISDNDEEEDEDEEEEAEPKLKYERLSADLRTLLSDDSASCIAVHSKLIALGTYWGKTHLLDAMGNAIKELNDFTSGHSVTVSQISIDHIGEYIASCSLDGQVAIRGLVSGENELSKHFGRPIKSIAIDPIYAKSGSGKRFMTGDDKVILHERGLFNTYKQHVLSENDGNVSTISWRGRFVAWSSRKGVKVFDVVEEKTISIIKSDGPFDDKLCPPRISWSDQFHLFVAMGDVVKSCVVKKRDAHEMKSRDLPEYCVQIASSFIVPDSWVCGVAPLDDFLVLLSVPKAKDGKNHSQKAVVQVVEPLENDYTEVANDILTLRGYERYNPKDYHLSPLVDEKNFFIVSPKDVVVAKPRDVDDRIDWLLDREKYSDALHLAQQNRKELKRHNVLQVGKLFLNHLLEHLRFNEAGELCVQLFGKDRGLWQDEVYRFAKLNQLKTIAPFLPTESPKLEPVIYEMTLFELMKTDCEGFLSIVKRWPSSLYHVQAIVEPLMQELLLNPDNEVLQRSLAILFSYQGKHDLALALLLKLRHEDVFQFIKDHNLFSTLNDKILDLMELNEKEAVKLFVGNASRVPPDLIVSKLNGYGRYLHIYLDELNAKSQEESRKFHGKLVQAYADFDRSKLLSFLKSSDHYPIQEALKICQNHSYIDEQIFIYTRMGNTREALNLITDELYDIHKAVAFCKEQDDFDLWQDLIDKSINKPYFINVLLHNIGTHVDPRILIRKIECGQEIPGLRDSLVQIIQDYRLQVSLQEGCKKILVSDCYSLLHRQVRYLTKGLSVRSETICPICNGLCIVEPNRHDLVLFRCRHAFHVECLGKETNFCSVCHKNRLIVD